MLRPTSKKSSTLKNEKYLDLITRLHGNDAPKADKPVKSRERYITPLASSSLASIGGNEGMSEEAAQWLREGGKSSAQMDDSFWNKKAPSKMDKLWNNTDIQDSEFNLDAPVNVTRQLRR